MRMAFGLVGVLVTLGVIIMIMHSYTLPAAKQAINTKQRVEKQFGSNTAEGMEDAKNSIVLDDVTRGGHFQALLVKSVTAGGPMATDFGLAAGDTITAIGGMRLRDNDDPELARAQLFEAKMRRQPLTVTRAAAEIQLTPQ
jgi:C-terminal processing protease CtpA/Prc